MLQGQASQKCLRQAALIHLFQRIEILYARFQAGKRNFHLTNQPLSPIIAPTANTMNCADRGSAGDPPDGGDLSESAVDEAERFVTRIEQFLQEQAHGASANVANGE